MVNEEGYELEVTLRVRYFADPKNYIIADNGDDLDAFELARIDATNWNDDFDGNLTMIADNPNLVVTVAPVIHID